MMIQNKEILDKLITNGESATNILDDKVPTGTDDEVLITTSRVV
jgi:hypothetical protein